MDGDQESALDLSARIKETDSKIESPDISHPDPVAEKTNVTSPQKKETPTKTNVEKLTTWPAPLKMEELDFKINNFEFFINMVSQSVFEKLAVNFIRPDYLYPSSPAPAPPAGPPPSPASELDSPPSKAKMRAKKTKNSEMYSCGHCGRTYERNSKPVMCEQCGQYLQSQTFESHQRNFHCDKCGKHFRNNRNLQAHKRYVHEGAPYKYPCDLCDKRFYSKKDVEKHKAGIHGKAPDLYKCFVCEAKLSSARALRRHEIAVHLQKES